MSMDCFLVVAGAIRWRIISIYFFSLPDCFVVFFLVEYYEFNRIFSCCCCFPTKCDFHWRTTTKMLKKVRSMNHPWYSVFHVYSSSSSSTFQTNYHFNLFKMFKTDIDGKWRENIKQNRKRGMHLWSIGNDAFVVRI